MPNPYAEGGTFYWFHLVCAACMRPEKFGPTLQASDAIIEARPGLRATAEFGCAHPRLSRLLRVERASSGRAHCRKCRELIEKGEFRLALQMFEEGRMAPIGTIHLRCAEAYFGTRDIVGRITTLTPDLSPADAAEIERTLRAAPPAPEAEVRLAKTRPAAEPEERAEASGDRPRGER